MIYAKMLPGIILLTIGIVLLSAYALTPSIVGDINLRQIFFLLPGVIFVMEGPVVAYVDYRYATSQKLQTT
jgi:hypothetical protein